MPPVAWFRSVALVLLAGCGGVGVDSDGAALSHVQSEGTTGVCRGMTGSADADGAADGSSDSSVSSSDGCATVVENPCWLNVQGGGFSDRPIVADASAFTAAVSVVPALDGIDGVIGLSAGAPIRPEDLAVALRFNRDRSIDAQNGDTFSSVNPQHYAAGSAYRVLFLVDVLGRSYSAWVNGRLVAENYAFHGAPGARLDRLSTTAVSEASAFRACDFGVSADPRIQWLHHDAGATAPRAMAGLASGSLLVTSDAGTDLVDPLGNVARHLAEGAQGIALDGAENRYLFGEKTRDPEAAAASDAASNDVATAYVSKYDTTFAPVFARTIELAPGERLSAFDVNDGGRFALIAGSRLLAFDPSGELAWTQVIAGELVAVALDTLGNVNVAANDDTRGAFTLSRFDSRGTLVWTRTSTPRDASTTRALALRTTDGGGVAVSGAVSGVFDLGGAELATDGAGRRETFVAWLDAAGRYLDGTVVDLVANQGLGIDAAGTATLGGCRENPNTFLLERVAFDGARVNAVTELGGHELTRGLFRGTAAAPMVDRAGNVYWALTAEALPAQAASFLLKLRP